MADTPEEWTEKDSEMYQRLAPVAVPARAEQIAALLTLLPFDQHGSFRVVELGCGQGGLTYALLDCFPQATVVALDGSPLMRVYAAERLSCFGRRACVLAFDLATREWFSHLQQADGVVSSLCLHHLSDRQKQELFTVVCDRLSPRGAFLVADLVEPQRPEARRLFAAAWDRLAEAQSLATTGSPRLFQEFVEAEWNYYRFPDPADQPSSLFDQLTWLKAAGLASVDCFWLQAGHAIYGGYKIQPEGDDQGRGISFETALRSAEKALQAVAAL